MSLANMSLMEEMKTVWWPAVKKHGQRLLVGGGVLTYIVSALNENTTWAQWLIFLSAAYIISLPFTISYKK